MNCESVEKELVAYLDGELEPAAKERVDAHLAECRACRDKLESLAAALDKISGLDATGPSTGFAGQFWERFENEKRAGIGQRFLDWVRQPAVLVGAGAAACLLVVAIFAIPRTVEPSETEKVIASHMELFADYEVIKNLDILEDFECIEALGEEG